MQEYKKLDKKIHQLSQILAKFNRAYVSRKPDDSHTNLAFDAIGSRILGRWVNTRSAQLILSLDLENFQFEIFDNRWKALQSVSIEGKTQEEIESCLEQFLPGLGLDATLFKTPLHSDIPEYEFLGSTNTRWSKNEFLVWKKYRLLANQACQLLLDHLQMQGEVRIWPHHFDTGIYVEPNEKLGIGFGLAMQDAMVDEPYFYISGYRLNGSNINYQNKPELKSGKWITNKYWNGAVLKLPEATTDSISVFIKKISEWFYLNYK